MNYTVKAGDTLSRIAKLSGVSLNQLLDANPSLKANPNKLNYSSSGIGSPIHMSGELFQFATGTKMIGALGKTQFMMEELPVLTSQGGKWVN